MTTMRKNMLDKITLYFKLVFDYFVQFDTIILTMQKLLRLSSHFSS